MIYPEQLAEVDLLLGIEENRLAIQEALTEKQRAERLQEYERLLKQPRCHSIEEHNAHPNGRWA